MSEFQKIRQKFESTERIGFSKPESGDRVDHVVIDVKQSDKEDSASSRRISLKTLEWLSGKVDTLRRKFSAVNLEYTTDKSARSNNNTKIVNNGRRKVSESDGDLIEMSRKYQICGTNKFTWIGEEFETIVVEYSRLMIESKIKIHRYQLNDDEPPRGILLLPLSGATGQALLDFSEMGGYSLGRGSRVAKMATRALSRTHCMIYLENNRVYIKDCDSKTGTFVNGKLLGSSVPMLLDNFDIIQMGYGNSFEDYIQSMVVFLDHWNAKEFASCVQQMTVMNLQSRTFSNSVSELMLASEPREERVIEKKKDSAMVSPLVSSPKMTQITEKQMMKPENEEKEITKDDVIVFERPKPIESQVLETMINRVESPVARVQEQVQKQTAEYTPKEEYIIAKSPRPERSPRDEAFAEAPKMQENFRQPLVVDSPKRVIASLRIEEDLLPSSAHVPLSISARPPIPKPRRMKKDLSKSAEMLVEVELEEIVREVERSVASSSIQTSSIASPAVKKMRAISSRTSAPATKDIAVPEFLKSENRKIPKTSSTQDLLNSAELMKTCNSKCLRKLKLPVNKKRSGRLEKLQAKAQFVTIVQGASTKRFENFVDFGTITSDISDGLAEVNLCKKPAMQVAFNNFRATWILEALNQTSGTKLSVRSIEKSRRNYELCVEGKTEDSCLRVAKIEMDFKEKTEMKVMFKFDDSVIESITGSKLADDSLPHAEIPNILIEGPIDGPTDKVTVSLKTEKTTNTVGKIVFEGQKINWLKRQMWYALDLDTSQVEIGSLLADSIQSVALLYCLRYHID